MLRKGLVVALVAGLVMAGIAIARDRGRESRSEPFTTLPAHSVTKPSKTVGAAAGRSAPLTKVIYRETDLFAVPVPSSGQDQLVAIRCPRRSAAIGGYFGDKDPGVVLDYSAISPRNVRKWQLGLLNTGSTANQAFIGVVCIK